MKTGIGLAAALAMAMALTAGGPSGRCVPADDFRSARECLDLMYYEQAVRLLGNVLADDENAKEARYWQGFALMRMNRLEQAAVALNGEIARRPEHWPSLTLLAYVRYLENRMEEAADAARKAALIISAIKPKSRREEPNAGLAFYILGLNEMKESPQTAGEDFLKAREYGYDPVDVALRLLALDLALRRFDGTLAASSKPYFEKAGREYEYEILGAAGKMTDGDDEASFERLKAAYESRPFDPGILRTLGLGYAERGDFAAAAELMGRALIQTPEDLGLRSRREDALNKRNVFGGEFKKSLAALAEEICAKHPPVFRYIFYHSDKSVYESVNQRFLNFVKEGMLVDAASILAYFLENADLSPTLNYNLGLLYNTMGKPALAFRYAARAVFQKPDYEDAHDLFGNLYLKIHDSERALVHYREALYHSPEDPASYYHLGFALQIAGHLDEAKAMLAMAIDKENLQVSAAEKESRTGGGGAGAELRYALTVKSDTITYLSRMKLGEIGVEEGDWQAARRHFEVCTRLNPKAADPYFEMGRIYHRLGEKSKSQECFAKYVALGGSREKVEAAIKKSAKLSTKAQ